MKKPKFSFSNLAPKQQKALIILLCSVLGFIIVVIAASAIIFSTKKDVETNTSSLSSSATSTSTVQTDAQYKYDKEKSFFDEKTYKDVILTATKDAGEDYIKDTVFVGDSNMERLVNFNLIGLDNFVGKTGMGISTFNTEACVYFENDNKAYTIPKAIAKMKPRRVIITFGTNDADGKTSPSQFASVYKRAIQSIQKEYAYCDIIINTVPPVARQRTYNNINMQTIDKFNLALADLAKEMNVKLLDSSSLLRGDDGFGKKDYFETADGIHLTQSAAGEFIKLVGTREYKTDDKRPDTKNIPKRRKAPAPAASSSSSSAAQNKYIVTYNVTVKDGKPLGTLQGEGFSGETTKSVTFSKDLESFTVTAVPSDGYEFVAWSDGVKTAKRTDTKITEKFSTTAKFQKESDPATIAIDKGASASISSGDEIVLKAVVTGKNIKVEDVKWSLDGKANAATGETYTIKGLADGSHTIIASLEKEKVSATITVKVDKKKTPVSVSVTPTSAEITEGGETTFTASIAGDDAKVENIVWKLDGTQVAAGASSYLAKGLGVGSHTVTVTISGASASATIKVNKKAAPSSSTPKPPPSSTPKPPSSTPTPPSSTPKPPPSSVPKPKPVITLAASAREINENSGSVTVSASVTNGDAGQIMWTINGGAGGSGATYTLTASEVTADMDFVITASLPDGTSASVTVKVKNVEIVSSAPDTSSAPPSSISASTAVV